MDVLDDVLDRAMRAHAEQVTVVSVDAATVRRGARRARSRDALLATAGVVVAGLAATAVVALPDDGGASPATPVTTHRVDEMYLPPVLTLQVPGGLTWELATQHDPDAADLRHLVVCTTQLTGRRTCPSPPLLPGTPTSSNPAGDIAGVAGTLVGWLHTDVADVQVTAGTRTADALVAASPIAKATLFAVPYAALGLAEDAETDLAVRALDSAGRLVAHLDRPTGAGLARRHPPASPPVVVGKDDDVLAAWTDASGTACTAWHSIWSGTSRTAAVTDAADWCGPVPADDVAVLTDSGFDADSGAVLLHVPPGIRTVTVDGTVADLTQGWGLVRRAERIAPDAVVRVTDRRGRTRTAGTVGELTARGTPSGWTTVVTWRP